MNSKLYGPSAHATQRSGLAQCRYGSPLRRHGNPVGVRRPHLVADGVGIGARDDVHPERAAAGDERAERIAVPQPRAAMVQRHFRRVVRDDAAGAQAGGVGAHAAEVVEPELRIEAAGIVLDERELDPAHRPIEPPGQRVARPRRTRRGALWSLPQRTQRGERAAGAGDFQKMAAGEIGGHRHVLSRLTYLSSKSPAHPAALAMPAALKHAAVGHSNRRQHAMGHRIDTDGVAHDPRSRPVLPVQIGVVPVAIDDGRLSSVLGWKCRSPPRRAPAAAGPPGQAAAD